MFLFPTTARQTNIPQQQAPLQQQQQQQQQASHSHTADRNKDY
jgi:hypothetical protein